MIDATRSDRAALNNVRAHGKARYQAGSAVVKRSQLGVTIIESVGALAVGTLMLVGLSNIIDTSVHDLEGQQLAYHQSQIVEAARKYIIQNQATLIDDTGSRDKVAITVSDLVKAKLLPTGFTLTNAYQQSTCVFVGQEEVQGVQNGKLNALVVTSGGKKIEDLNIAVVASSAGKGGGYITDEGSRAKGSSWELLTSGYEKPCGSGQNNYVFEDGHLASYISFDESATEEFVYRYAVPGNSDLSTMLTPIMMGEDAIKSIGGACDGQSIAVDVSGSPISCVRDSAGVWRWSSSSVRSTWKKSVDSYSQLAETSIVGVPEVGEVRVVRGGMNRAFVYTGSGWTALAVDQIGDLTVPGDAKIGRDLTVAQLRSNQTGNLQLFGSMSASGDITSFNVVVTETTSAGGNANIGLGARSKELVASGDMSTAFATIQSASGRANVLGASLTLSGAIYAVGDKCENTISYDQYSFDWDPKTGTKTIVMPVLSRNADATRLLICNSEGNVVEISP